MCEREGLDPAGFRYGLSDFCAANLEAWAQHPRFVPLFTSCQLERARFDGMDTSALELEHGGKRIGPGDLGALVVVIANYLLDSIPADLLCFRQRQVERGLVRLRQRQEGGDAPEAAALPQTLKLDHRSEPLAAAPFAEPILAGWLAEDQRQLAEEEESWLLFPAPALRALERLAALSRQGLLLLSADKGHHRLEEVLLPQPPGLVRHGSFSLSVNYHALCGWAEAGGCQALVPDPGRGGLHMVALLHLPEAADHRASAAAWPRHLAAFGPGDHLKLSQLACANAEQLSAKQLLAFLRLGQGDSHLLRLLTQEGPLRRLGLLGLLAPAEGDAPLKGGLRLSGAWLEWIAGAGPRPGAELAAATARRLETGMAWQDLVLPAGTLRQLEEIETYLEHRPTLLAEWGMAKRLRPGNRALFHGPPGTGKTLTAALLGAKLGLEVRRVDLSQAVSKYIGETEKNLAAVMDRAEQRQWPLVFEQHRGSMRLKSIGYEWPL